VRRFLSSVSVGLAYADDADVADVAGADAVVDSEAESALAVVAGSLLRVQPPASAVRPKSHVQGRVISFQYVAGRRWLHIEGVRNRSIARQRVTWRRPGHAG
jgi:hypothetical protein